MEQQRYTPADKMARLIADDYRLIHVMSRFGITVGFGEKTVEEVCGEKEVDPATFLAVVNYVAFSRKPEPREVSPAALLNYLRSAHAYFLEYSLPSIRRRVLETINLNASEVSFLIMRLFDEYVGEVSTHMQYEETHVFPHIKRLLEGHYDGRFAIDTYSDHHDSVADKLHELKSILLKYSPSDTDANGLNDVLYEIYRCESDLENHCLVEDDILVPAIRVLEEKVRSTEADTKPCMTEKTPERDPLSEREKEIVQLVVRGMTNKEIAERLFLSVHTVLTHRRNIARKLEIHSATGLTIFAIVNGLVDLNELTL